MVSSVRKYLSRFFSFFFKKHEPSAPEKPPRKADAPEKTVKKPPRKADIAASEKTGKKADIAASEKTGKKPPRKSDIAASEKTEKETPDAAVQTDQTVLPKKIQDVPKKEAAPRVKRDKKRKTRLKKAEIQPSYSISKNGIRILTRQDSLSELFTGEPSGKKTRKTPDKEDDDWIGDLENSLSGENFQILLQEKKNAGLISRVPTVTERIRHYPLPQDEIDLHGYTAREAEEKTDMFIQNARHRGIRTLRIIVGKGLHSEGKAVLRDVVEDRLAYLKKKEAVLSFRWEKHNKLKSGSMIVYLM
jgi:DNA-nicking Smr family endonuclease